MVTTISTKPVAQVWTSPAIGSTWTAQPYLRPVFCNWQLAGFGTAEFRFEYGRIKQPGASTFADVAPLDIDGHFVMIQWSPEYAVSGSLLGRLDGVTVARLDGVPIGSGSALQVWVGIVTASEDGPHTGTQTSGTQRIFATDPKLLLQRIQITKSWVVRPGAEQPEEITEESPLKVDEVPMGIAFNAATSDTAGASYAIIGNKDATYNGFSATMEKDKVALWRAGQIVEYLINYPIYDTFEFGVFRVPEITMDTFPLNYYPINVETHGRNVFDILNQVIDRRRGFIWWLEPVMDETLTNPKRPRGFKIRISTVSRVNVQVTPTESILANPTQRNIDLRGKHALLDASMTRDVLSKYQQVIVEGASPSVTFSIKHTDAKEDWTDDEKTRYRNGAKDVGDDYTNDNLSSKKTLNDQIRQSDQLKHVFTRYRLETKTLQGPGMDQPSAKIYTEEDENTNPGGGPGAEIFSLFPDFTKPWNNKEGYAKSPSIYDFNQAVPWEPLLRLERQTRLLPRVDYSAESPSIKYELNAQELMRPLVFFWDNSKSKWHRYHDAGSYAAADELRGKGGQDISVGLRMHEHQLGFDLVPSDGVPHRLDRTGIYDGAHGAEVSHVKKGIFDANDYLLLTLTASTGAPLRITYPQEPDSYKFDQRVPLLINLGERARLDWVVGGTAYDVTEDNTKLKKCRYTVLRDDRESMYALARAAWTWYSTVRRALQYSIREIVDYSSHTIGTLIKSVIFRDSDTDTVVTWGRLDGVPLARLDGIPLGTGELEPVNTVISSVHIDWDRGTTSIATQFSEIDFQGIEG